MKIINCMKTEEAAIELLNSNGYEPFKKKANCHCECGQTQAVLAYSDDYEKVALVGICDACGDDDAFSEDVIQL